MPGAVSKWWLWGRGRGYRAGPWGSSLYGPKLPQDIGHRGPRSGLDGVGSCGGFSDGELSSPKPLQTLWKVRQGQDDGVLSSLGTAGSSGLALLSLDSLKLTGLFWVPESISPPPHSSQSEASSQHSQEPSQSMPSGPAPAPCPLLASLKKVPPSGQPSEGDAGWAPPNLPCHFHTRGTEMDPCPTSQRGTPSCTMGATGGGRTVTSRRTPWVC